VLQLSNAILDRRTLAQRKAKARKKVKRAPQQEEASASAPIVVRVNGRQLALPADERQLKKFINAVSGASGLTEP